MPTIDEIKLKTKTKGKDGKDAKGGKTDSKFKGKPGDKTQEVHNSLSNSSGTLYINKPNNKSARKRLEQYPIFAASNGASVYFTQDSSSKALFDSTISFKIPPFTMDSLSGKDATKQGFKGKFSSGGIFPDFDERLVVMKDLSLGFEHFVPEAGYPLYQGKGTYHTKIILDKQGIQGNGEIHYLNTTLKSEKFQFFKDSVTTIGFSSITKPGTCPETSPEVTFPDMTVKEYKLLWLPKADSMFITATKEPIQFYKNTATLQGTANITKNGTLGKGILLTRGSEAESKHFQFEQTHFEGRNSRFQVNTANPAKPALLVKDAKLEFDLDKNVASFGPEVAGFASTEFPYAQYKSSLDIGKWDLKAQKVTMTTHEGGDMARSYFYSTHPEQDSLVFNATEAVYDIVKSNLKITGIPFIRVADAMIIPDSNKVYIEENAVITTLLKAKLIVDTLDQFHKLYDGAIDIKSKKRFEGVATYQYVNLGADTLAIKFQEFTLQEPVKKKDPGPFTVATGTVKEEDNFVIGPKILYKGKVTMYANNKNLYFDGYLKLDLKGELQKSQWLRYINEGDSSLVIALEKPTDDNGNPLVTGLHFGNKTNELYTTFISQKKDPLDADIFLASGMLEYYSDKNEFGVASKEKIVGKAHAGNILKYNDTKSSISYQGKFNFLNPSKNYDFFTVGEGVTDLKYNSYDFNTMIVLNSKVHASVISSIGKSLRLEAEYLMDSSTAEQVQGRDRRLPYQLGEVLGNSAAEKFVANGGGNFLVGIPEMTKGIVLSDVNLKWSSEHKSYYSVGKIYVSNIGKEEINKPINGYVEIKKSIKGDEFHIYLEPVPNSWYFITYEDNRLAFVTSNDAVNSTIQGKYKAEPADRSKFYFARGDVLEQEKFLDYFKEFYVGAKEKSKTEVKEVKPVVKKADKDIPISPEPMAQDEADKKGKKKDKKKNDTNAEPKSLEDIEKTAGEKVQETVPEKEPVIEEPKEEPKVETPDQETEVGQPAEETQPQDGKKSKKKSKKKEKQSALESDTEQSGQ